MTDAARKKRTTARRTAARAQRLIAVRDVKASVRWYAKLLGFEHLPRHRHREVYDRMLCDGSIVLQLHAWEKEDHPNLVDADAGPNGHGVLRHRGRGASTSATPPRA